MSKTNQEIDWHTADLTLETVLTETFEETPNTHHFFKEHTDNLFKFLVEFRKWIAENTGKSLKQAISEYRAIKTRNGYKYYTDKIKKAQPSFDATQSYALAFLKDNPNLTMKDVHRVLKRKGETQPYKLWDIYNRSDLDL